MRKILLLLLIFTISVLLAGCRGDVGSGVFIGPYGGGSVFFSFSADKNSLTAQDIVRLNEMKNYAVSRGYTVSDYETYDKTGFKAVRHVENIKENDLAGLPDLVIKENPRFITVKKSYPKDEYQLKAIADLTNTNNLIAIGSEYNNPVDSSLRFYFKLNLPVKAKHTNADRIYNDGKTLEWNLNPGKKNLIEADFEL
ncbi:MAG: hypothetical protein PHC34_13710 [Candidatus Gastranaerophilales bacterium]|nr:hypothetical protein [Candidatus Gastranaerophilales bacterium]